MKNKQNKLTVLSLFSGCGGKDLGMIGGFDFLGKKYKENNIDVIWANEIDKSACFTYAQNIGNHIHHGDIRDIDHDKLPYADIVAGGFPCQDFSHAGKRRGFESRRGMLYLEMVNIVKKIQPKAFFAENVKGLLTMDKGEAIKIIAKDFEEAGYRVKYQLLLAANYGVPQKRERVIIIGIRNDLANDFVFPVPTHSPDGSDGKLKYVSAKDALDDLADIVEGSMPNHFWSRAKMLESGSHQGNYYIDADKPAPTMRAEHHGNIEGHYNGKRRLSAREAARIQSFPDNFIFYKSNSDAYRQIGNAIPPILAWNVTRSLVDCLKKS